MQKSKMHLVPVAVIDCAQQAETAKNSTVKETYLERLRTTKEFCEYVLNKLDDKKGVQYFKNNV